MHMHNYLRHAHGHAIAADQLMIMLSVTRHRFPVQVELLQEIDDLSAFRGDVYGLPEYSCCSETQSNARGHSSTCGRLR